VLPKNLGTVDSIKHLGLACPVEVRADDRVAGVREDLDQGIKTILSDRVVQDVKLETPLTRS